MPTQVVSARAMKVGKKNKGGKHWTAKELAAREEAAKAFERADDAKIKPPVWLSEDAREIWDKKIAEIAGLNGGADLLDALDSENLALYCDAIVHYKRIASRKKISVEHHRVMQTYMARILGYSEKLGFTPGARARLIKKRADPPPKDKLHEFD